MQQHADTFQPPKPSPRTFKSTYSSQWRHTARCCCGRSCERCLSRKCCCRDCTLSAARSTAAHACCVTVPWHRLLLRGPKGSFYSRSGNSTNKPMSWTDICLSSCGQCGHQGYGAATLALLLLWCATVVVLLTRGAQGVFCKLSSPQNISASPSSGTPPTSLAARHTRRLCGRSTPGRCRWLWGSPARR